MNTSPYWMAAQGRSLILCALLTALVTTLCGQSTTNIYTTATSEGLAYRNWSSSPADTWIESSANTYSVTYDGSVWGKYWSVPVFNFQMTNVLGQNVTSATLYIYTSGIATNATYTLRDYSASIGAAGSSSATYAQATGGTVLANITGAPASWLAIDVSSSVTNAISHNWSWLAYNIAASYPTTGLTTSSTVYGVTSSYAPYIAVTSVPEPAATVTLVGLFAGLLMVVRRRPFSRS